MAKKDDKEELVPVGDGAEIESAEDRPDEKVQVDWGDKDDDEKPGKKAEEKPVEGKKAEKTDEGDEDDERVGHGEDEGEDREAIKARRRQERHARRDRERRNERELGFLRNRNEQLERRFSEVTKRQDQQEVMTIDGRIAALKSHVAQAEQVHALAVEKGDGKSATEALQIKDSLNENIRKLEGAKEKRKEESEESEEEEQQETRRQAPRVDPAIRRQAQSWLESNPWFDTSLRDETSYMVKALEDRLTREGEFDPRTSEYWEELNKRAVKLFPHLKEEMEEGVAGDDDEEEPTPKKGDKKDPPKKNGGGPKFRVGGRERPLAKNEVFIDAERRKALEEAGVWDDPVLRARYLRSYQTYDRDAQQTRK